MFISEDKGFRITVCLYGMKTFPHLMVIKYMAINALHNMKVMVQYCK